MKKLFLIMTTVALSAGMFFASCSKDDDETPTPTPTPTPTTEDTTYIGKYNNAVEKVTIYVDLSKTPLGIPEIDTAFENLKGTFALQDRKVFDNELYMVNESSLDSTETNTYLRGVLNAEKNTLTFNQSVSPAQLAELMKQGGVDFGSLFSSFGGGSGIDIGGEISKLTTNTIKVTGVGNLTGYNKMTYNIEFEGEVVLTIMSVNMKIPLNGKLVGVGTKK